MSRNQLTRMLYDGAFAALLLAVLGGVYLVEDQFSTPVATSKSPQGLIFPTPGNVGDTQKSKTATPAKPPAKPGINEAALSHASGKTEDRFTAQPDSVPEPTGETEKLAAQPDRPQVVREPPTSKPLNRIALEHRIREQQAQGKLFVDKVIRDSSQAKVEFFETASAAESVAFVVDRSGSMQGGRLQRTKLELAQSIVDLKTGQQYYVVFFDDGPMPMPHAQQPNQLAKASPLMKLRTLGWINQIDSGGGTYPESSLTLVAALKPDVIYLLSDGQFNALGPQTYQELSRRKIVVHTIAFASDGGAPMLKHIADQTGGTYRFVPETSTDAALLKRLDSDLAEELISGLNHADPAIRQEVRQALITMSGNLDFGPNKSATDAERLEAIQKWTKWWFEQKLLPYFLLMDQDTLIAEVQGRDPLKRSAAIEAARRRKLRIAEVLIETLQRGDATAQQEARQTLVELSGGDDYGPEPTSTQAERTAAIAEWSQWLQRRDLAVEFADAGHPRIVRELNDADPNHRWAAAIAAGQIDFKRLRLLLSALDDLSSGVQGAAHQALVQNADGLDYGPAKSASDDERLRAINCWTKWVTYREIAAEFARAPQAKFIQELSSDDPTRRWAAVTTIREQKLDLPDPLIPLLEDRDADVVGDTHRALVQIARGKDFGPANHSDAAEQTAAMKNWKAWRREEVEEIAAGKLRLAKTMLEGGRNPSAAKRRFEEIVELFPETKSAAIAKTYLKQP